MPTDAIDGMDKTAIPRHLVRLDRAIFKVHTSTQALGLSQEALMSETVCFNCLKRSD